MASRSDGPLFETRHGAVIKCACCGHLEVTFMGGTLRVAPKDFGTVAETVARTWNEIQESDSVAQRWQLRAETAEGMVSVEFAPQEIAELHELLHGASVMLELDDMLAEVLHE